MKKSFNNLALEEFFCILNKINVLGIMGYAVSKTKRQILSQIEPFLDQKQKLLQKYGKKNQDGKLYISQECQQYQSFLKQFLPIANLTIKIDIFQISQEDFQNCQELITNKNLNVQDFDFLQQVFVKKQEQDKVQ